MARLPIPQSDDGTWGDILNDFLAVEHNTDGTLKQAAAIAGKYVKPGSGIPEADLSAGVQTKLNSGGSVGDATTTSKGVIQLSGDLDGTADTPIVPALATKANDTQVVHIIGDESIDGVKTFTSSPAVPDASFTQAAVQGLTAGLSAKYVKPGSGIPEADLSAGVQTKLNAGAGVTNLDDFS